MTSTPPNKPPNEAQEDAWVEALLQTVQAAPSRPSETLIARVLQDAQQVQRQASRSTRRESARAFLAALREVWGWPALGGYATVTLVGLWVGMSTPDLVLPGQSGALQSVEALLALDAPLTGDLAWTFEEG